MCPEITNLDTSMNGSMKATLSTGSIIGGSGIVVCHSISTNRPDSI